MPRSRNASFQRIPASRFRSAVRLGIVALALLGAGCVQYEVVHYPSITRTLDGKSELHISTYPSGFPREVAEIPFIRKTVRTPESIFFQVYVRDAERRSGPNPHVESVRIRSFAYTLPNQAPIRLIVDHDRNFWAQDQDGRQPGKSVPVPCIPGQAIGIDISLELNGVDYAFEDETTCSERTSSGWLIVHAFSN
jgi:hypothetical protein